MHAERKKNETWRNINPIKFRKAARARETLRTLLSFVLLTTLTKLPNLDGIMVMNITLGPNLVKKWVNNQKLFQNMRNSTIRDIIGNNGEQFRSN